LPAGELAGWFRGLVDSWSIWMNLIGKVLPFLGDAPFGSNYDLMFARRTGGYTFWFWFGLCSQAVMIALGLVLKSKLGGGEDEEEKVKALAEVANEINQACPKVLDDWTRIDSAVAGPGLRLTYRYTLTLPPGADADAVRQGIDANLTAGWAKDPGNHPVALYDLGIEIVYAYKSPGGEDLFSISRKKA
jgi:hypothetical protein